MIIYLAAHSDSEADIVLKNVDHFEFDHHGNYQVTLTDITGEKHKYVYSKDVYFVSCFGETLASVFMNLKLGGR